MDTLHITENDINKICRICLKNELLHSIYNTTITYNLTLRTVINYLSFFKIDTEGQLPTTLCQSCVYRLLDAYNLKQQCESSESKIKHYLENSSIQYPYISSKSYSTLFNISTVTDLSSPNTNHFTVSPVIHHAPPIVLAQVKRQECEIFDSMNCDIFAETQNSDDIEVTDDVLNDVEIDVSSLTRSDFNDDVIQQSVHLNNNFSSNNIENRINTDIIEFNKTIVKDGNVEKHNYNNAFEVKTIQSNEICLTKSTSEEATVITEQTKKHAKKSYECPDCSKILKTFSHFEAHKRVHSGLKPYKCKRCPKTFAQIGNFNSHMNNVHLERRQYQCEICSKLFTTSSNLKQHKVTHINQKHFTCTINDCKKQFRSANELKNHQKIHSNIKNFKCSICDKSFLKKSYLNLHDRIVHKGEKSYKCKQCLKQFSRSSNFISHERIHTGIKPFLCKICNSKFNQASALSRHTKTCHFSTEKNNCKKKLPLNPSQVDLKEAANHIIYNNENLVISEYGPNEMIRSNTYENVSNFPSYNEPINLDSNSIQRDLNHYDYSKGSSKFYN